MWIRKIYRSGDSWLIAIPADVRGAREWRNVHHVEIFYEPPRLIIHPLNIEELMRRPRGEGKGLADDALPDPRP